MPAVELARSPKRSQTLILDTHILFSLLNLCRSQLRLPTCGVPVCPTFAMRDARRSDQIKQILYTASNENSTDKVNRKETGIEERLMRSGEQQPLQPENSNMREP